MDIRASGIGVQRMDYFTNCSIPRSSSKFLLLDPLLIFSIHNNAIFITTWAAGSCSASRFVAAGAQPCQQCYAYTSSSDRAGTVTLCCFVADEDGTVIFFLFFLSSRVVAWDNFSLSLHPRDIQYIDWFAWQALWYTHPSNGWIMLSLSSVSSNSN